MKKGVVKLVRTVTEIEELLESDLKRNEVLLDMPLVATKKNPIIAILQLEAIARLRILYWVLGKERPRRNCEFKEGNIT